ncbi:uncharacterized protein [Cicer arietinum]|uniref:uncharacterized protein n=1 Tax=Cicer arietinum TaxID=3827 RepID=UPI003CC51C6C
MDASISLGLRFSNKNEELKLLYGPLFLDVTSDGVLLGKTKLNGFSQMPRNDTDLDMTMTMNHASVNKYDADELKSDIMANEMVFDVFVSGNIGVHIGSLKMINVPFLTSCEQIKRMDVDFGRRPGYLHPIDDMNRYKQVFLKAMVHHPWLRDKFIIHRKNGFYKCCKAFEGR